MSNTDTIAELGAMTTIAQALESLETDARKRVMAWAQAKFLGVVIPVEAVSEGIKFGGGAGPQVHSGRTITDFGDIADFYHACIPTSDAEKALVISSWFQVAEGVEGLDAFRVNSALKHLGYGIGNATRAFDQLTALKPSLLIQLRKAGTSKQARKTFRVTDAGLKRVHQMLNSGSIDSH